MHFCAFSTVTDYDAVVDAALLVVVGDAALLLLDCALDYATLPCR